ncbi:MAG: hypothetical protein SPF77_03180, partial [Gemmiger sp.]|uniref:hypothetical protein n=1 Tax=Gemmiger sp. TaxID=2049027 RepID=UPI002A91130E
PDICCLTPRSGPVSSLACGSLLDWAGSSSKSRPLTNWDAQLVIAICVFYKGIQKLYNCQTVDSRAFASPVY